MTSSVSESLLAEQHQGIRRSQVIETNQIVADWAPEIWQWMAPQIDTAVEQGWLRPA